MKKRLIFRGHYTVPPSSNHIYTRTKRGTLAKTKQYEHWRSKCAFSFIAQQGKTPFRTLDNAKQVIRERLLPIEVHITMRIKQHHDIANREKGILDALQDSGIIDNDRLVHRLVIERAAEDSALKLNEFTIEVYRWIQNGSA